MNILEIKNLKISIKNKYHEDVLVKGVSFNLQKGDILGIVGESGSGKTLTCKSLINLFENTALFCNGEVIYNNQNIINLKRKELNYIRGQEISMIFQNPSTHLDPLMKIGDQIAESYIIRQKHTKKEAYSKVINLLKSVNINKPEEKYNSYPHEFSGGMKQRVMIAAALACNPKILIADEPTTALDVTVQSLFLKLLKKLNKDLNISIILVSHDLGVIANICNKIIVMKDGYIQEIGNKHQIINNPQKEYTKELINSYSKNDYIENGLNDNSKDIVFDVKNLSVNWKKTNIFNYFNNNKNINTSVGIVDVSFKIFKGNRVGIVGESGSGKSTLAKAIINIQKPSNGEIYFNKNNLMNLNKDQTIKMRQDVQMIFQDPYSSLNPKSTIRKLLIEPLKFHKITNKTNYEKKIVELMFKVGLDNKCLDKYPHQLSGGQCQRVNIARALSVNPKILIADEPTSSLDVTIQAQIIELIINLCKKMELTLIFISHDLRVVKKICNKIIVMKGGKIIESGSTYDVFHKTKNTYTKELITSVLAIN